MAGVGMLLLTLIVGFTVNTRRLYNMTLMKQPLTLSADEWKEWQDEHASHPDPTMLFYKRWAIVILPYCHFFCVLFLCLFCLCHFFCVCVCIAFSSGVFVCVFFLCLVILFVFVFYCLFFWCFCFVGVFFFLVNFFVFLFFCFLFGIFFLVAVVATARVMSIISIAVELL